jgi:hypothetical protein
MNPRPRLSSGAIRTPGWPDHHGIPIDWVPPPVPEHLAHLVGRGS